MRGRKLSTSNSKTSNIQVISRAATILRVLAHANSGLSLGQIASRCDLPRSTVQRITQTLQAEGFVLYLGENMGFSLGPEIQALASSCKVDIWRSIHSHLMELANSTGETVDLAVLQDDVMIFVDQVPGRHRLRAMSEPGARFSAFNTANGKACLSLLSNEVLIENYEVSEEFINEISTIRDHGVAWDLGEHTQGISAVGAAFVGLDGQSYAVSIPVPSLRFENIKDQLTPKLLRCIEAIKKG